MGGPVASAWARLRGSLGTFAYAAGWTLIRWLPERAAAAAFRLGADLAWRRGMKVSRRLEANLARVVPDDVDRDQLGRDAMRSYARYWLEVFRLPVMPAARISGQMFVHDEAVLRDAYAEGKGVILALPHMGNWDHAGAWLVDSGVPFTTVAERLEPAELFDRFVEFREQMGFEVLALSGGERPPFDILAERLRAGGMLCLLADRDLTAAGVPVTFFGSEATMPAGPAALALRTGAALLPVTLWYPEDGRPGWRARIHPPVPHTEVAAMTQTMADAFAEGIAAHPQDWHMVQRLWRDDLDPERARVAGSEAPTAA